MSQYTYSARLTKSGEVIIDYHEVTSIESLPNGVAVYDKRHDAKVGWKNNQRYDSNVKNHEDEATTGLPKAGT